MRILLLSLILFSSLMPGSTCAKETDCGLKNIKVEFSAQIDAELSCEGIQRALNFFEGYGHSLSRQVHVRVLDHFIPESMAGYNGKDKEAVAYACFDKATDCSYITSWESDYVQQRKVFDSLPVSVEYHTSIVAHEVAHCLYHQIFDAKGAEVERPLTEFVSYVVQIETMKEPEKTQVLKLWPNRLLRSELAINSFNWAMAPHKFGIMSYRYYQEDPNFMKSILEGEVKSGDKIMPLF